MNQFSSKSAQNVQDFLNQKGLSCTVLELSSSTKTAIDAAASIGCDVAQIVKSLIFKTAKTSEPILVLASGPNRVNEKVIESYVGEAITKADAAFTKDVTGFTIGGIPPIGHKQDIKFIFIDEDLKAFDCLWAAAGTPHAAFKITYHDLTVLSAGKTVSII